jgi:UDP-N-acetylmuramoyl-tripeptide--D-alanyl-D-alanine ligase
MILKKILKYLAIKIMAKYRPEIIGITGSVGKTSAKEAARIVLSGKFNAMAGQENYNNELGIPLTIIGAKAAGKNIFGWLAVFWRAASLIIVEHKSYPRILILEMGVDRPGDMDYLLGIAQPDIGILTRIGPVHLEFFGTQEKILLEKSKLIKSLPSDGFAILNYDYPDVYSLCDETKAKCVTYGLEDGADVQAKNINYDKGALFFDLVYGDKSLPIVLPHAIGKPQVYAILSGICCGIVKGMSLEEIKMAVQNYMPAKGRGMLLPGIKNTIIIDDTYNASPQSVEAALQNLKNVADASFSPPARGGVGGGGSEEPNDGQSIAVSGAGDSLFFRKGGQGRISSIAVLGDMLELGSISEEAHFSIGKKVAESGIDYLYTKGVRAKNIAAGAKSAGMNVDKIFEFSDNLSLGKFLQEKIERGDIILVKGSRGMKMEEIIKEIADLSAVPL